MVNQYKEKIRRFDCAVKIVILDDELEFSKILDKKIKEYCARKDLLYDCQIFSSGKTLLEDDLSSIQVAFLDIDMPEFNGLDVAKVLHQRYPEMILIFVTFFIVRSLSKDSSLILLDEPTSALDQKSITTLIEYLELRKQQAIIVIVSHDSRILSSCDELVEMR